MMKTSSEDKSELIEGIMKDAQEEADRIIKDAETAAADKMQSKIMQLKAIERDALKKEEQQTGIIEKNSQSAIAVEKKRTGLKIREELIKKVVERIRTRIKEMESSRNYPEILRGWILEAAIGLGENEAVINSSLGEREIITDDFMAETGEAYNKLTGRKIKLYKSEKDTLFAQGIVLSSGNNRTAFNNQVPARIARHKTEIQKEIYNEFFT